MLFRHIATTVATADGTAAIIVCFACLLCCAMLCFVVYHVAAPDSIMAALESMVIAGLSGKWRTSMTLQSEENGLWIAVQ